MQKRLYIVCMIICLMTIFSGTAFADSIRVSINNNYLNMDVPPVIQNGRTLVPLMAIFEAIGANVSWDEKTRTVTANREGRVIKLVIDSISAEVDGKKVNLDVPAKIMDGRTMVPARFVAESLGANVEWDGNIGEVIITLGDSGNDPAFAMVKMGELWGIIDKSGEYTIIPGHFEFSSSYNFSQGVIGIKINGKWGYINGQGNIVIEPKFDFASDFSEGLAGVEINGKRGYIDRLGDVAIEPAFEHVGDFSEGLAPVELGGKWGYIDNEGNMVIRPAFDEAENFNKGFAAVNINGEWCLINTKGAAVAKLPYEFVDGGPYYSEDLAAFYIDGKFGFIDRDGSVVIEPQFDNTWGFSDGLAAVMVDWKWGYIDKHGDMKIEPKFNLTFEFSEGLAAAEVDGKWGYVDEKGEFVIESRFDFAESFSEGLAAVEADGKWGYVDMEGNVTIEPRFDDALRFNK